MRKCYGQKCHWGLIYPSLETGQGHIQNRMKGFWCRCENLKPAHKRETGILIAPTLNLDLRYALH